MSDSEVGKVKDGASNSAAMKLKGKQAPGFAMQGVIQGEFQEVNACAIDGMRSSHKK